MCGCRLARNLFPRDGLKTFPLTRIGRNKEHARTNLFARSLKFVYRARGCLDVTAGNCGEDGSRVSDV